ncbi:MAG: hypothetical protein ACYC6K_11645 [Bellilinea sp.]
MTLSPSSNKDKHIHHVLLGNGFVIDPQDNQLVAPKVFSSEQEAAFYQKVLFNAKNLNLDIDEQIKEFEEIIFQYNPIDLIGCICLRNSINDPEDFKEYKTDINPAFTEYIALFCASKQVHEFAKSDDKPLLPINIEDIHTRLRILFNSLVYMSTTEDIRVNNDYSKDMGSNLQARMKNESLGIRYSDYHQNLLKDLLGIFAPISSDLEKNLGFTINNALLILDSIGQLINNRLDEKHKELDVERIKLNKAVSNYRHKKKIQQVVSRYPRDLLERLKQEKPSDSKMAVNGMISAYFWQNMREIFLFTESDVADSTGLEIGKIGLFLKFFSIRFGEVDEKYHYPSPTHPLMTTPFIQYEDKYICPVINSAYWALRPSIEQFLNLTLQQRDQSYKHLWQKYLRNRANYLEETAIDCLASALQYAKA